MFFRDRTKVFFTVRDGEPILQDSQGMRDFSSNLPDSKVLPEKPYKLYGAFWTCAGWTGLSFRLVKNFILNGSIFPRALSRPIYFSQKLPCQRLSVLQQHQWKHFFQQVPSHLSEVMCISLPYSYEESNEVCISLCGWTGELGQIALWPAWWPWQRIRVLTSHHSLRVLRCTHSLGNFSLKRLTTDLEMILNIL